MKEHQRSELKQHWRDEYLRWICGFANAQGGTLEIGKNDRGEVVGVANAAKLLEDIPNKVRDILGITVEVNLHTERGNDWLEIVVDPYPTPISYRGEYHYRSGSTKQELKGAALERFLLRKHGRRWDDAPTPGLHIRDCSQAALKLFKSNAAKSGRMTGEVLEDSTESLLDNLHLTDGNYFRRATALLFYDNPEQFVSGAYIKIGFFLTHDDLRYQDEIHGSLFEQVEKTLDLLYSKYLKAYIRYEGLQRVEEFLFPYLAMREAILNAVVHKDYSSGIPIQISVYEDRIVLWNDGQLPEDWTMERFLGKHASVPYNPLVANAFFRAGYIESWGRGIEKIARECREHDMATPVYEFDRSGLMITFHANPEHLKKAMGGEKFGDSSEKSSGKSSEKIINYVRKNPRMTISELAKELGLSTRGVEKQIANLKSDGILQRIGPAKGGYWVVKDKDQE